MVTDNQRVGASYVIAFYQNVSALTDAYAQYANIKLQQIAKYGQKTKQDDYDDQDLQNINMATMNFRVLIIKSHLYLKSLGTSIVDLKVPTDLENLYKDLATEKTETYIINLEKAERYVLKINEMLLSKIVKDLLDLSNELFNTVYLNDEKQKQSTTSESSRS